jgi:hypothetical protein
VADLNSYINVSANTIRSNGANITGNTTTGVGAINSGVTNTLLPNTIASFNSNVNYYTQVTLQNKSTGADATADYILTADNGSDTVNYLDLGIINSGYDANTPTNSLGNIVFAADGYLYAQGNTSNANQSGGNLVLGTTVPGKNVKIFAGGVNSNSIIANISNTGIAVNGNVTATNFSGNITIVGNVTGTSPNVTLVAGSYSTVFDNTGNIVLPGNTFSVNYANGSAVNPVTRFTGSWTVPAGSSTQSFSVPLNGSYTLWIRGNIPNGIITYTATAVVTNTNVPVLGDQYGWYYVIGNALVLTSLPNQFTGTAGSISNVNTYLGNTANVFTFGITNNSGGSCTIEYGYIQIG